MSKHGEGCCEKEPHFNLGELHGEKDDSPYCVDGLWYCGRCHCWLGAQGTIAFAESAKEEG